MIGEILSAKIFGRLKWIPSIIFGIFALVISKVLTKAVPTAVLSLLAILFVEWAMLRYIFKVRKPVLVIIMATVINILLVAFLGALIIGFITINIGGL